MGPIFVRQGQKTKKQTLNGFLAQGWITHHAGISFSTDKMFPIVDSLTTDMIYLGFFRLCGVWVLCLQSSQLTSRCRYPVVLVHVTFFFFQFSVSAISAPPTEITWKFSLQTKSEKTIVLSSIQFNLFTRLHYQSIDHLVGTFIRTLLKGPHINYLG